MIEFTSNVDVRNVKITGGWDGVHFRGWSDNICRNISITDCRFFTGDDSIAGRYARNLVIKNCIINSSCNGIRIIGPVTNMIVDDCLFFGPGLEPHRSSRRNNMLSGIILQPGGWDACPGPLEDVLISNVTMKNVASPVNVLLKRSDNTADNITITDLKATDIYRAPLSVESWCDTTCGRVVIRDSSIEYVGAGTAEQAKAAPQKPGVDARPLPVWGFYARNAKDIALQNVRLYCTQKDFRPAVFCEDTGHIIFDAVRFTKIKDVAEQVVLKSVKNVETRDMDSLE